MSDMEEFKEIISFASDWDINNLAVSRQFPGGVLCIEIIFSNATNLEEVKTIYLSGINDPDCIPNILEAEGIVIVKELSTQRDFGTYQLQCIGECYSEYWFDSIKY